MTYEQVFWFQVAMNNVFGVEERESFGQISNHVRCIAFSELHALRDRIKQVATLSRDRSYS